jgi:hypothetical protein
MSEDNHRFEPSDEICFDSGEDDEPQHFILDAAAHEAGHGPHPGKYRKPRKPRHQAQAPAKEPHTKPHETTEAFCTRLGIRMNKRVGGVEFCPSTFLVKQLQSQRGKGK